MTIGSNSASGQSSVDGLCINTIRFLAVEAGSPFGWQRYTGDGGEIIGVERFGASAPGGIMLKEYGFTVENVCSRALALMETL